MNSSWETWWRRPTYSTIWKILTDPTYAGVYGYGRTASRTRLVEGTVDKQRFRKQLRDWSVLIHDHHEGYITWERFEKIQRMMSDNVFDFDREMHGA